MSDASENEGRDLYALTCDGEHVISRIPLGIMIGYVDDNAADNDTVQYNGNEWSGVEWRRLRNR